jgi:hypothetical protein
MFALFSVLLDAGMHGVCKWHVLVLLGVSAMAALGAMSALTLLTVVVMGFALAR